VNLLPFLTGSQSGQPHAELFWRVGNRAAIRSGDWKALRNGGSKKDEWELYKLTDDVGESRSLSRVEPDRLARLRDQWEEINAEMIEPLWR
jgi:arylsulfatase B